MQHPTRLFDFAYYQKEHYNLSHAFVDKVDGQWKATSITEFIEKGNAISRALLRLDIAINDKIGLISMTNRSEWNICDLGILQVGAQDIPIYPTSTKEDYQYILNHSESVICFVSCREVYDKISAIRDQVPTLKYIYSFDVLDDCPHWSELLTLGDDQSNQDQVDQIMARVGQDDLATIIYTSGTTGKPKGVMLSHQNISANIVRSADRLPLDLGHSKALSFLPVCHIYERMLSYMYQYCGIEIYFAESLETISANLQEIHPDVMTAVPRLLEKVYDKIYAKGAALTGVKRRLFFWAVDLGLVYEPYGQNGWWYEFQLKIARVLIFKKWQEALGGNLRVVASGSAALQPRLARVFNAAGIPIMEGYGLTETSPVVTVNDFRNYNFRIGTVGKAIADTEIKFAPDGEILVKGPQIMMGYYKDPELTAEVIKDGYFHTGDIGEMDADGFLKITDRKKEMFKTSGGKYIAPQVLENALKQSRFIDQVMVIGENQKMPAALIQPNYEFIQAWGENKKYNLPTDKHALSQNPKVIARIQEEIDTFNERFGKWEQIKRFELIPEVWSIEQGHLTPTMKMKRKVIYQQYKALVDRIYADSTI